MKLMFFNDFRLGVLRGEEVVDVTSVADSVPRVGPHDIIAGVIEHFDTFRPKLEDAAKAGKGVPVGSVQIRPPLPRPRNIVCMAVNYMEDGTRTEPAADQRLHQVAECDHRPRRHHGAARCAGDRVRGRGRSCRW